MNHIPSSDISSFFTLIWIEEIEHVIENVTGVRCGINHVVGMCSIGWWDSLLLS